MLKEKETLKCINIDWDKKQPIQKQHKETEIKVSSLLILQLISPTQK